MPRATPASTKRAPAKRKRGRPSRYAAAYAEQARKLCLLGATDAQVGDFFGVSETTVNNWKHNHPEFLESLKAGKALADATVADSLFKRATGYRHRAVKILTVALGNNGGSAVEQVPYIEKYPPDTTAAIFWLKNRRPDQWRDKQEVQHTGDPFIGGVNVIIDGAQITSTIKPLSPGA